MFANNNMFSHVMIHHHSIAIFPACGASSNVPDTNDPSPFFSYLSQNWGGGDKTILPLKVNKHLKLCAGKMFLSTGTDNYLISTLVSWFQSLRLNLDTTPSLQMLHNQEGDLLADSCWQAPCIPVQTATTLPAWWKYSSGTTSA